MMGMKVGKQLVSLGVGSLSVLGLLFLYSSANLIEDPALPAYAPDEDYEFVLIHDLKERHPTSGYYKTEGYIAKVFNCPACPAGAECMPCPEENIVVSEQQKAIETYALTKQDLLILVQNPDDRFKLGERYRFSIRVRDSRSTDASLNDVELVGYSP